MLPTYEEYLKSCAKWQGKYQGINWEIVHHGVSDYEPKGIWNFYIYLSKHKIKDFNKFYRKDIYMKFSEKGNYHLTHNYHTIPDMGFKGGITYYENISSYNPKNGQKSSVIKIGCDYNHSWDSDRGYPDDFESVKYDCLNLIDNYKKNGYLIEKEVQDDR